MTTTLDTPPLAPLLDRLFAEADAPATPEMRAAMSQARGGSPLDFYSAAKDAYLAVSRETGALLYMLARGARARNIVEFGTSFGISTLHLAAALFHALVRHDGVFEAMAPLSRRGAE